MKTVYNENMENRHNKLNSSPGPLSVPHSRADPAAILHWLPVP